MHMLLVNRRLFASFVKVYVNFANVCLKEMIKTCARLAVCKVRVRKKCTLNQDVDNTKCLKNEQEIPSTLKSKPQN